MTPVWHHCCCGKCQNRVQIAHINSLMQATQNQELSTGTASLNRMTVILDGYVYGLDLLGLRTNITRNLGLTTNTVVISYDGIDEVTSWSGKEAGGALRHNEQLAYAYDAAGNLHTRTNDELVQNFNRSEEHR